MTRLAFLPLYLVLIAATPATALETRATAAYVLDETTGTELLAKNAEASLPPASMSKIMTLFMLFEAVRDGRVTMETEFSVSTRAKEMQGSTMFLNELDRPTVEELIRGIIVNSGNDACVVVAEGLAGTEEAFSRQMTERALELGMTSTNLTNASGWPEPAHRMSMRDLGILARHLIEDFPQEYKIFAETEFDYKDRAPANRFNRNPLLDLGIGADGLKTGHTVEAGFGLVGSAVQSGRRVIFVITGLTSSAERAEEAERIVNWAFRDFTLKTLAKPGVRLAEAEVWMGAERSVGLVVAGDVQVLVAAQGQKDVTARVTYKGPLEAPLAAGATVAELIVTRPDLPDLRVPLLAETDVARGGFATRVGTAAGVLIGRLTGAADRGSAAVPPVLPGS